MSRRCASERLLAFVDEDPRFLMAGLSAAMLYVRLARYAMRMETGGVLVFGSVVGSAKEIAVALSIPATEAETLVDVLIRYGLLHRRQADNALVVPYAAEASARSQAARANGERGGRPRKGETAAEASERRRGATSVPIEGERPKTQGAEAEPGGDETRTTTTTITTRSNSGDGSRVSAACARAAAPASPALCAEVAEIAGLDAAFGRRRKEHAVVEQWLTRGATPDLIRGVLRDVASRTFYAPRNIQTLGYFSGAVMEALRAAEHQGGATGPPRGACVAPPGNDDLSPFARALERWSDSGMQGPPPEREDFPAVPGPSAPVVLAA